MSSTPAKPSLLSTLIHHYDDLVDHVRKRFGDRSFAREVVHDVCVQVMEKTERGDIRTPLALLRKISHDQAVSRYRSERRHVAWTMPLCDANEPLSEAPSPSRCLESTRELDVLIAAISALPPRCQAVFVMHKVHEVPQAEVARHLGISLKTVEKHLRLGMAACRNHLQRTLVSP